MIKIVKVKLIIYIYIYNIYIIIEINNIYLLYKEILITF